MERYNRNILIKSIGQEGQKRLLTSKVLIAGAGGLGSTVIANLTSVGVGNIGIIDNDAIELSNLNRQYIHTLENIGNHKVESAKNWINNFNPDINIKTYKLRLNENNYANIIDEYELIIDCFDSYKSKFLLNKICVENNKTLVHGGVTEFYGQVTIIIPGLTPCLNCIIPKIEEDTYIPKGVISPAVSTIASIEAMEAVKILLNIGDSLAGKLLTYDGLKQEFRKINIPINRNCPLSCLSDV